VLTRSKVTITRLLPLALLFVLLAAVAFADPIPTSEWVNLSSYSCTLNGNPLPIGALVDVYDPDTVHCGRFIVHTQGEYGFLPVYRDDKVTTPGLDEGADPGDTLKDIRINDVPATQLGPDVPVWTMNGDNFVVDLSVEYLIDLDVRDTLDDVGSPSEYTTYHFRVVNTGEGTDFFHLSASSEHGWSVDIMTPTPTGYVKAGDSLDIIVRTLVPANAEDGDTDDLTFTATSAMDGTVFDSEAVTTTVIVVAADEWEGIVPGVFRLFQNYPNPFNPATRIEFTLEQAANVRLEIYNVLGQRIRILLEGYLTSGSYEAEWDGTTMSGTDASSGIYFYRLSTDQYSRTRKMILMK
jgi:hypothetical protein